MSRWIPVLALALAIGVGGIVVAISIRDASTAAPDRRAATLAAELRCPDCQGLSVADSPTRSAREMRRQIDELVDAGASDDEVRAHFVARYGEWVRLAPSAPAVWLVPFVVLAFGAAGLLAWLTARARTRSTVPAAGLSDDERQRLRDEVEALDA